MNEIDQDTAPQSGVPHRTVLIGGAAAATAEADPPSSQHLVDATLTINGLVHALSLDPRVDLRTTTREAP